MSSFRPINRAIGLSPRVGSFALYQVLSTLFWGIISLSAKNALNLNWMLPVVFFSAANGLTLLFLGDKPWLFLSRLEGVPQIFLLRESYQPLLKGNSKNDVKSHESHQKTNTQAGD